MAERYQPIPPGTSDEQRIAVINQNFAKLDQEVTTKLYFDSNGVPNISIGLQPDGTNKIKVAKSGFDVTTAGDDELIFNSDQNVFKITQEGSATIPAVSFTTAATSYGTDSEQVQVAHGLGYAPVVIAHFGGDGSNSFVPLPYQTVSPLAASYFAQWRIFVSVDDTNITFVNEGFGYNSPGLGSAFTFPESDIYYYVLQETAN